MSNAPLVLATIATAPASPAATGTAPFAGTPSTSGWDIVYAVGVPSINNLLQNQFCRTGNDNVPNPFNPISTTITFGVPTELYRLYVSDFQLSAPSIAIDPGNSATPVGLQFYITGGTFLVTATPTGAAGESVVSYSTIVPNRENTLSGQVPLTGGLNGQSITFDLSGGAALETNLQVGNAGNVLGQEIQSVLESGDFAVSYSIGSLSLPASGLFQPVEVAFGTQVAPDTPGDAGRLLYLVATQVEPGGGALTSATTAANFTGTAYDFAMVYSYRSVLAQIGQGIGAAMAAGMASTPTYTLQDGSPPQLALSGNLSIPNMSYTYGGSAGYDTNESSTISGTTQVMFSGCAIGLLPGGTTSNPVGFYNGTPSATTTFTMSVSNSVNGVTQIGIPNYCTIKTCSNVTYTNGIGATVTASGDAQLTEQAGLTVVPVFEDGGDGTFNQAMSYTNFNMSDCVGALTLPPLYTYVVPQLNAQLGSTVFKGFSTFRLPTAPASSAAVASLPADLFIQGSSGVTPWSVTPSVSLVETGAAVSFGVQPLTAGGSAPAVNWTVSPAAPGALQGNTFTAPAVPAPTTYVITASDATNQSVEAYATVTVVPATLMISPQVAVVPAGQSTSFEAALGTDVAGPFAWSVNNAGQASASNFTFTAPADATEVTVVTVTAAIAGQTATAFVVVTPPAARAFGMSPVQSSTQNAAAATTITATGTDAPAVVTFTAYPSGFGYGTVIQSGNTASYTPPIGDTQCPFNVFVVATVQDGKTPWYGVAMVSVTVAK